MTISKTLDLTVCILSSDQQKGKTHVKFLEDKLVVSTGENSTANDQKDGKDESLMNSTTVVQGSTSQTWSVDYPLLVYSSHLPNNSELVIANLARRNSKPRRLSLGNWHFICFVSTVCLTRLFHLSPLNCQILFLARHRKLHKLRLFMLDQDPWSLDEPEDEPIEVYAFASCEFRLPERPLEHLRSAHLLVE